jgi:hypothetical protein
MSRYKANDLGYIFEHIYFYFNYTLISNPIQ